MTETTNLGLKKIDGNENWREIFDDHNDSMDKTDGAVAAVQDGLAIVANGDTHAAVAEGKFVYVRNHSTLAEGLYKASSAIGTNAALSTSNLTADGSGGLNDLQEQIKNKADKSAAISNITRNGTTFTATRANGTTFTFTQQDSDTHGAKTVEVNLGTVTIAAGGSTSVTKAHGMTSGYTALAVTMSSTSDGRIIPNGAYVSGSNIVCQFANISATYQCSGTVKMQVLGIKA